MQTLIAFPDMTTEPSLPGWALPALAGAILVVALPGPAAFLAGIAGVVLAGLGVAGWRRAGGPGVPTLPFGID